MKIFIFISFVLSILVGARDFKVAAYNVENLFDLHYDKTEYKEFIPNTKSQWNQKSYTTKLNNISKVIQDLNADILGLVEIENKTILQTLMRKTNYKYGYFIKNNNSAIGLGIISRFPIIKTKTILIKSQSLHERPILEADIMIERKPLKIFVNHWKSKKSPESTRVAYAIALKERIKQLAEKTDYIILGDLNSNYNEFETFKKDKKLNNTDGFTGINHILGTIFENNIVTKNKLLEYENLLYNLWLETNINNRMSQNYRGSTNTPDNIIIPKALFDNTNISYKQNSFGVFKKSYFYKDGNILRWKMEKKIHKTQGYSDHLPIFATFSTSTLYPNGLKPAPQKTTSTTDIYFQDELDKSSILYDVIVLFKHEKTTIIKQVINRAAMIYGENNLEVGHIYDIKIKDIGSYYGLQEIKDFDVILHKGEFSNPKRLFIDANTINIFDPKYTNEIIYNLLGFYSNGYLVFNDKKIKIFAKNKTILPANNKIIRIKFGHLAIRNTKPRIIIYTKENYVYVN